TDLGNAVGNSADTLGADHADLDADIVAVDDAIGVVDAEIEIVDDKVSTINTKVGNPVFTGGSNTLSAILGDPGSSSIESLIDTVKDVVDDILLDTTDIEADTRAIGTPAGPTIAADIADIKDDTREIGNPAGGSIAADIGAVKGVVDDILADTSVIGTSVGGTTIAGGIGAVKGVVDDIIVDTAAIDTATQAIQADTSLIGTPDGSSIAADIATVDDLVDDIHAATVTNAAGADIAADIATVNANVGTPAFTGGDDTLSAILGDPGSSSIESLIDEILADTSLIGTPDGSSIAADIDRVASNVDSILLATVTDAAGGNIAADIIAIAADTAKIGDFSTTQGSADAAAAIEAVETQIAALIQTGTSTEAVGGSINTAGVTVAAAGIAYVTVTTTTDGTSGVTVQLEGSDACTELTIVGSDSPYTCAFAVAAGNEIVVAGVDAGDDAAAVGVITIISTAVDATTP
ncbi:MAG: hypothetical protein IS860_11260, partial [Nitrosopumilus sp.]|nr:hypothetical protein [Nitrosopumilus sp.]